MTGADRTPGCTLSDNATLTRPVSLRPKIRTKDGQFTGIRSTLKDMVAVIVFIHPG